MSIAVITGASSGIGSRFVRELAGQGDITEFWLIARRRERMEELARELGIKARIIPADLSGDEGIAAVRAALEEHRPSVSYLVNAAGFGGFGRFDELPEDEIAGMIDLNVKALVLITHMTVPYMERGGRIIELGSGSCFTPLPNFNVYASSKAFVLHYTKALSFELKRYGVSATCFCPGWVDTEFIGKAVAREGTSGPRKMKPMLSCERVVRGCLRAAKRGRVMYVTNWYTKLQHLLFKLVPDRLLTRAWMGMQRKENNDGKKEA